MGSPPVPDESPARRLLVAFGRELRAAGLPVGSGDVLTYCAAMAPLDPTDLLDLYWAGRTTLVTRRDQIPVYDRVFRRFFLDEGDELPEPLRLTLRQAAETQSVLQVPATEPAEPASDDEEARLGLVASDAEVLRNKSFAACTPEELAALRRIMRADPAHPAAPADPAHDAARAAAAGPTRAARCARRCGRTASPPSCSGAAAGCGRAR